MTAVVGVLAFPVLVALALEVIVVAFSVLALIAVQASWRSQYSVYSAIIGLLFSQYSFSLAVVVVLASSVFVLIV